MNMQQLIQQEVAIQNTIVELLPTIGLLAPMGDRAMVLNSTIEYLRLRNTPEPNIAALQPALEVCIDRVIAKVAQLTAPA